MPIKRNIFPVIFLVMLQIFIFTSCTSVYLPNVANTTFYENKGDLSASVFTGTSGFDGQLSYAFSDHLYILGGGAFLKEDSSHQNYEDYVDHSYFEGGLGYYMPFGKIGRSTFHVGVGKGNSNTVSIYHFFGDNEIPGKGRYLKYFFQNNIGFSTKVVDLGGSIRYNYVDFYKFKFENSEYRHVYNHFIEPAFFVRVGWKNIRYQTQISYIYSLRRESPFDYDVVRLSIGISFKYNLLGKD